MPRAELLPTIEEVVPHQDYWLASYALPCEGGWLAYTKLCWQEPADSWDNDSAFAKVAAGPCPTARAALSRSMRRAVQHLERLETWASGWPDLTMA